MDINKLVCPDIIRPTTYPSPPPPTFSTTTSLESLPSPIPATSTPSNHSLPPPLLPVTNALPPLPPPLSNSHLLPFIQNPNPPSVSILRPPALPTPVLPTSALPTPTANPQPTRSQSQRVECALCGKSFSGISSHNRHVSRTHHKARPFSCNECGLQFGQKGSLDRHTSAVHLKERPYTCDHCGKGFGRKDNMKIHMTTVHLKKKPYKCDMCPKSFGGKRPLKIHRQTVHFKQRPLQCPLCDKRFGQRSNLNVHMKVHRRVVIGTPVTQSPPNSPIGSVPEVVTIDASQVGGDIAVQSNVLRSRAGGIMNVQLPLPMQPVRIGLEDVNGIASTATV